MRKLRTLHVSAIDWQNLIVLSKEMVVMDFYELLSRFRYLSSYITVQVPM